MKQVLLALMVCAAGSVLAQGGREAFLIQQAQAELGRVTSQMDVLQNNYDEVARRVSKLEGGGDTKSLKNDIEGLRAELAAVRREMAAQRGEIVNEIVKKLRNIPSPAPQPTTVTIPPHKEYTIQPGDTLSLVAQAFNTSVSKILEMNPGLKANKLKVGQKVNVPK